MSCETYELMNRELPQEHLKLNTVAVTTLQLAYI